MELFLMRDGRLLINEVAPRPHNSGHYSLDACTVSQFEQQVRALCGQPLGEVRLLSPAVMLNLIGDDVSLVTTSPATQELLREPGAVLHLYGKRVIRSKRKMGHITFLASTGAEALAKATAFRSRHALSASVRRIAPYQLFCPWLRCCSFAPIGVVECEAAVRFCDGP